MEDKIKVLSVGSLGRRNKISIFRKEQGESLKKLGIHVDYFHIKKRAILGYLKSMLLLKKKLKHNNYELIHAHYGLSGMVGVSQRKIPVVVTFHGSDIWKPYIRPISLIVSYLSKYNIFISTTLLNYAKGFRKKNYDIIPCGLDLEIFYPVDKRAARLKMKLDQNKKYVLFSSSFTHPIKNFSLAKNAIIYLPYVELIELKGYSKEQVNYLMNACDALLVASKRESGPLVVKEAMACNLPIVTTDVGDVKDVIGDTSGCYVVDYNENQIAKSLKEILQSPKRTDGRVRVEQFDLLKIAKRLSEVFHKIFDMTT